jgi:hypothetical protein
MPGGSSTAQHFLDRPIGEDGSNISSRCLPNHGGRSRILPGSLRLGYRAMASAETAPRFADHIVETTVAFIAEFRNSPPQPEAQQT